mgnify:CR=1 FL=1
MSSKGVCEYHEQNSIYGNTSQECKNYGTEMPFRTQIMENDNVKSKKDGSAGQGNEYSGEQVVKLPPVFYHLLIIVV